MLVKGSHRSELCSSPADLPADRVRSDSGGNCAATLATHNVAWRKLCAVYGHDMPRTNTDINRIEDVLKLVEAYQ